MGLSGEFREPLQGTIVNNFGLGFVFLGRFKPGLVERLPFKGSVVRLSLDLLQGLICIAPSCIGQASKCVEGVILFFPSHDCYQVGPMITLVA